MCTLPAETRQKVIPPRKQREMREMHEAGFRYQVQCAGPAVDEKYGERIARDEDGRVKGLSDEITKLAKTEGTSFRSAGTETPCDSGNFSKIRICLISMKECFSNPSKNVNKVSCYPGNGGEIATFPDKLLFSIFHLRTCADTRDGLFLTRM